MIIRGKIPEDLKLYASEVYQDPSEENNTWMVNRPRTVLFNMKDTKTAQGQSKLKNNNDMTNRAFGSIYLKFTSISDCVFSIEVTFPEEEDYIRVKVQGKVELVRGRERM